MQKNELASNAELEIAKSAMRDGMSGREVLAVRHDYLSERAVATSFFVSVGLSALFGNGVLVAGLLIFWAIGISLYIYWRKKKLDQIRKLQLMEFQENQK